jgi:galactokinase
VGDEALGAEIVAFAPGRVNLIGDHTDYVGGLALPMAVELGTTVRGHRVGDLVALRSRTEDRSARVPLRPDDPRRAEPAWARYVAGIVAELDPPVGFDGVVDTTLPVGAGLSSSAALELAIALALGFEGSAMELARLGQRAEHRASGVPCGLMDQLTSACGVHGHALLVDFGDDSFSAVPMPPDLDVVVVHSGQSRSLTDSGYADRRRAAEAAARELGPLRGVSVEEVESLRDPVLRRRARHVVSENARVRSTAEALAADDGPAAGALLSESHASLRDDAGVSTPVLDEAVRRLMAIPGVHGARLTGAGFGGCVVALADAGAVTDPSAITGRGWIVTAAAGARLLAG